MAAGTVGDSGSSASFGSMIGFSSVSSVVAIFAAVLMGGVVRLESGATVSYFRLSPSTTFVEVAGNF